MPDLVAERKKGPTDPGSEVLVCCFGKDDDDGLLLHRVVSLRFEPWRQVFDAVLQAHARSVNRDPVLVEALEELEPGDMFDVGSSREESSPHVGSDAL